MSKQKRVGTTFENDVVARAQRKGLQAKRQPGSGVFKDYPNDAIIDRFLIECKVRAPLPVVEGAEASVRVEYKWFENVNKHAAKEGMTAALVVRPKGARRLLAVMDFDDWLQLVEEARKP